MRVLLLTNNWVGWKVAEWLVSCGEEIVGLVLHSPHRRRFGEEIISATRVDATHIIDSPRLHDAETLEAIKGWQPDIGVSVFYGYILRSEFLELLPAGCVNIHPGLLPYDRGAYPNVWSIIEDTPTGVTLHYIDEGVDTGDIIAQRPVPKDAVDTGESLYRKLELACVNLFQEQWPLIRSGQAARTPQPRDAGTSHRVKDVERIDAIDLDRTYTARELIDILRARTFPPHPGAYFRSDGRKVYLRLQLLYEDQLSQT